MSRRKGQQLFHEPLQDGLPATTESSFEEVVRILCFSPEHYAGSAELRALVERNKDVKYVPPELLAIFGLTVEA